jgi:hypothetical protein
MQRLHRTVAHGGYAQRTQLAIALGDMDPAQWLRTVSLGIQCQECGRLGLDRGPEFSIHSGCSFSAILRDLLDRQQFGSRGTNKQALQAADNPPSPLSSSLGDTYLQPSNVAVTASPVDALPVHCVAGSRSDSTLDRACGPR